MAVTAGRLGGKDLPAATWTLLYECPVGNEAFVNVNMLSRSGSQTARLALVDSSSPANEDMLEYDFPLTAGMPPLLREGLYLKAGEKLYAWASATGVSAVAYGKEAEA